jgi:thiamine-phosphate pyrophosphorylase
MTHLHQLDYITFFDSSLFFFGGGLSKGMDDEIRNLYTQGMGYIRTIDANLARLSEGLRVIEDVCRFELSNDTLTHATKAIRNELKIASQSFSRRDLVNARSTGTDVRANATAPRRQSLTDLLTANAKRATEASRSLEECTNHHAFSKIRYRIYDLEQAIWHALTRAPLMGPGIYVVSDSPAHLIACAKKPYVPIVQYRNKGASKSIIFNECLRLAKDLRAMDVIFIVNDHVDIAIGVGADGVHVGQDDIPTPHIRACLGHTKLIGRTTHTLAQGHAAATDGADYVSVGPIWDTPSKPGRPGIGVDYLKNAHQLPIPFVAIGGINVNNMNEISIHNPPLIGAIRSTVGIEELWESFNQKTCTPKNTRSH